MALKMPDLLGERYKEWASLPVGGEHIIDWEPVPRGAHLKYQDYRIILRSVNVEPAHQLMVTRLTCWWLPVYGDDAAEMVNTSGTGPTAKNDANILGRLKLIYDKYVPKVASNTPGDYDDATDQGELSLGDVDTNLFYQPGSVSLATLTNPARPSMLYDRQEWLGQDIGKGYLVQNAQTQVMRSVHEGYVRRGLRAPTDGYLVWVLVIPGQIGDDTFSVDETFPADGEFNSLSFLAPTMDPIMGWRADGSSRADWLRWVTSWLVSGDAASDEDDKQTLVQTALRVSFFRHCIFGRQVLDEGTVSPNA